MMGRIAKRDPRDYRDTCSTCVHWEKSENTGQGALFQKGYCPIFNKEKLAGEGRNCTAHETFKN